MAFVNQTTSTLLRYWQEGEWRSYFNVLPIPKDKLKNLTKCSCDLIQSGQLDPSVSVEGDLWIAPIVYQNSEQAFWIPLWLPAYAKANQLHLRKKPMLPWLPLNQFESSKFKNLFCEPMAKWTEWCLNDCLDEEKAYAFQDWPSFYKEAIYLLDTLSQGQWSAILQQKGYTKTAHSFVFGEKAPLTSISPVLQRYVEIEDEEPNLSFETKEINENAHLLCAVNSKRPMLTQNERALVIQTLLLGQGDLIGIEAPSGSNKEAVIEAIVSSKYVYATLHDKALPAIYRLAPTKSIVAKNHFVSEKVEDSKEESLEDLYQDMISGLNLAERLCEAKEKEQMIDEEIARLQAEDEEAEKTWDQLLQEQQTHRAGGSLKDRFQRWFHTKEDPLSEAIRQCKVQRTKIHQQLVETVEEKVAYRQAEQYWQEWCLAHGITLSSDLFEDISHAHQEMASRVLLVARGVWQSKNDAKSFEISEQEIFSGWTLYRWREGVDPGWVIVNNIEPDGDLLIIDNAEQLYPQQIYSFLANVNQAFFFGDPSEFRWNELIDAITEDQLLSAFPLFDDEQIDMLQYKGMLISTGNALRLALANSSVKSYTEYGEWRASCALNEIGSKDPRLLNFCNLFHSKKLVSHLELDDSAHACDGLHFLPTTGQSHLQGVERINPMEVRAIQEWFARYQALLQCKTIVIVTLYEEQCSLLQSALGDFKSLFSLYTLENLPYQSWDYVIFSSVLTARDPRPYLFDQNDTFFYSLVSRASRGLWVAGDSTLFNPKTHSPSGKLAKHMLGAIKEEINANA